MKVLLSLLMNFVLVSFLSSCAISYNMPDTRFETPETTGKRWGGELNAGYGYGKDVELTSDFSQRWVDTDNPTLKREKFLTAGGRLGIDERIDLGLQVITDLGTLFKAKYQFLGKKGEKGFQAALSLHGGSGGEKKEETSNTYSKADLDNTVFGGDLILGYRFNEELIGYSSFFSDYLQFEVNQTRGTTTRLFKGKSRNTGGNLGLAACYNGTFVLKAEYAGATLEINNKKMWSNSYGLNLALNFK
jgi:hypothetical protein